MADAMDAVLMAMLEDVLQDPSNGPIRQSFLIADIKERDDLLAVPNFVLDGLTYDDNGTAKDVPPLTKTQIKDFRNFLLDRTRKKLPIDSSTFTIQDFQQFSTSPANVCPFADTHHDVAPADKTTADPVVSTTIDSIATTTVNVPSAVENESTIDTSSYGSPTTTNSKASAKAIEFSNESKQICIHGSTSKEELDTICYSDSNFANGRFDNSILATVCDENRSSDNIISDDVLILPKKVPPDPYDRDNPVSNHCHVDAAHLCNNNIESVDIIVNSTNVAAGLGVTDNQHDEYVSFNAYSASLKVTTTSELIVAAARSIGNDAKHAQNAVFDADGPTLSISAARPLDNGAALTQHATFDDDDPHIEDAADFVSTSLASFVHDVQRIFDDSIADLPFSAENDNEADSVSGAVAAADMVPLSAKDAQVAEYGAAAAMYEDAAAASAAADVYNDAAAAIAMYADVTAAAAAPLSAVDADTTAYAAAAAMVSFSAEDPQADEYEAAADVSEAAAAAAAVVVPFSAVDAATTEYAAAAAAAGIVIHDETIFHQPNAEAAAAAVDNVLVHVDHFVPSDNTMRLDHAFRSKIDTTRYDQRICRYAFAIPTTISMRFKASSMPRNVFHSRYYCQQSEQDVVQTPPMFMPRQARQLVHHRPDSIDSRQFLSFDTSDGTTHCSLIAHDVDVHSIILYSNPNNEASTKNGETTFRQSTYAITVLILNGRTFRFKPNYDGTDLRNKMHRFTSLDSSKRSIDINNPTGTKDKGLLRADIITRRLRAIDVVTMQVLATFPRAALTTNIQTTICTSFAEVGFIGAIVLYTSPLECHRHRYTNGDIRRMERIPFLCTSAAHDRTRTRIYRVLDSVSYHSYHLLGRLIIRKIIYMNTGRDISNAKQSKDFDICRHLNDCALFMLSFEAQCLISKPTKNIVVIEMTKAIRFCSFADAIGILGIPVHTRWLDMGVADTKVLVKLRNIRDEPYSFDSITNDVQNVNGEPGSDTDVQKDGEPYDKQHRRSRNRKSDRDESARKRAEKAHEQYVRKATVVDSVVESSQGTHFVRDAKSDGEKKQQSQSLDTFEKLMIPLLTENGEPCLDDRRIPMTIMAPNPDELQGRAFLTSHDNGEQVKRARTVEALDKHEAERFKEPALVTRLYTTSVENSDRPIQNFDDHNKNLVTDDTLSNRTIIEPSHYKENDPACSSESQEDKVIFYRFHPLDLQKHMEICTGHIEMHPQGNVHCRSMANAGIEWKNGERFYQPPDKFGSFESALKYQDGFDIDKGHVKNGDYPFDWEDEGTSYIDLSQSISARKEKKLLRLAKQARLRSFRADSKDTYEFRIPKDYEEGLELDVRNRNPKRHDITALEMSQLADYDTRIDKGEVYESKISNDVPINDISYMSGDNESMINSSTVPHARSHKRHNILSYHLALSMGACGYISMNHLRSESNVSDVLSQHRGYKNSYESLLKPIFHHTGNVGYLIEHDVPRYNEDKYDPVKHHIVYLKQKMGSVETRKRLVRQS